MTDEEFKREMEYQADWKRNPSAFAGPNADGVRLRDYFAAQALSGVLALHASENGLPRAGKVAQWAYEYADAMLEERLIDRTKAEVQPAIPPVEVWEGPEQE